MVDTTVHLEPYTLRDLLTDCLTGVGIVVGIGVSLWLFMFFYATFTKAGRFFKAWFTEDVKPCSCVKMNGNVILRDPNCAADKRCLAEKVSV